MLITPEIKELVALIDQNPLQAESSIKNLILQLDANCKEAQFYNNHSTALQPYPIDADGYAKAFDPLENEEAFLKTWNTHGIVVGKQILNQQQCHNAITRLQAIFNDLSQGLVDFSDPKTFAHIPRDEKGVSLLSRGFAEIYHDYVLAQIRQNVRAYIHHVLIWQTPRLWTSFDRVGIKLPNHDGAKALPLHVDQNPNLDPDFKTIQGVLALGDCPEARGTFRAVSGSKDLFACYKDAEKRGAEYAELSPDHALFKKFEDKAQALPLRAGDMVSWDSRTTHANTANLSNEPRFVFYMAAGPANEHNAQAVKARLDAFAKGAATSPFKVPDALLRASIKPRYSDSQALDRVRQKENLTLLGKLSYGLERYGNVLS